MIYTPQDAFTAQFYQLLPPSAPLTVDDDLPNCPTPTMAYCPERHGSNLDAFQSHADFALFKQQYEALLDQLLHFAVAHHCETETSDAIKEGIDVFKQHLFDETYCDAYPGMLWNSAREMIVEVVRLLHNKHIPLAVRKLAVEQLAEEIQECAQGALAQIGKVLTQLQSALLTGAALIAYRKEQLIEQIIIEFIRKNSQRGPSWEVHYVNAYINLLAQEFGLKQREFEQTVVQSELKYAERQACCSYVKQQLTPQRLVEFLADDLLAHCVTLLEAQGEQCQVTAEQYALLAEPFNHFLEQANRLYSSQITAHSFWSFDEESSHYQLIKTSYPLQPIIAAALMTQGVLHPAEEQRVTNSAQGIVYTLANRWFWLKTAQDETLFLEAIDWLQIAHHDPQVTQYAGFVDQILQHSPLEGLKSIPLCWLSHPQQLQKLIERWGNDAAAAPIIEQQIKSAKNAKALKLIFDDQAGLSAFFSRYSQTFSTLKGHLYFLQEGREQPVTGAIASALLTANFAALTPQQLTLLFSLGAYPNARNDQQQTPLMIASHNGQQVLLELLLAQIDIDVNLTDRYQQTALMLAAEAGKEGVVKALIKYKALKVNLTNFAGESALMLAINNNHEVIGRMLLKRKDIALNLQDGSHETALFSAIKHSNSSMVKQLLKQAKVDVNLTDDRGCTPLILALKMSRSMLAQQLLNHPEIKINTQDCYGITALMVAVANKQSLITMQLLSRQEIKPNLQDKEGLTALMYAVEGKKHTILKQLLQCKGIKIDLKNEWGKTAFMLAAEAGNLVSIKQLLKCHQLKINLKNATGQSALFLALEQGHEKVTGYLLKRHDVNPNLRDTVGETALMLAVKKGSLVILEQLLGRHDIKVNLKQREGRSSLILAVQQEQLHITQRLLQHPNINVNLKDNAGKTALMWAIEKGCQPIVTLLLNCKIIQLKLKDKQGHTLLMLAQQQNDPTVIDLINQAVSSQQTAVVQATVHAEALGAEQSNTLSESSAEDDSLDDHTLGDNVLDDSLLEQDPIEGEYSESSPQNCQLEADIAQVQQAILSHTPQASAPEQLNAIEFAPHVLLAHFAPSAANKNSVSPP